MGILNSNKTVSKKEIKCGESFDVTLSLSANPDITSVPKDIVLVADYSGSMRGAPLDSLKNGMEKFLDIIDVESDGKADLFIGGGSRAALVKFSTTAEVAVSLTNSVKPIKEEIQKLQAGGNTNHKDAFLKAVNLLSISSAKEKIIIMFTDGQSNKDMEGFAEAEAAKRMGISIYCIAYGDEKRLNFDSVNRWVSSPSSAYAYISPSLADIETAFEKLVRNIAKTGATSIYLKDAIDPCFKITSVVRATKGTASILGTDTVEWNIPALGTDKNEGAECVFTVQHKGNCSGMKEVNKSIEYSDAENNIVSFASPSVNIVCDDITIAEKCPEGVAVTVDECNDAVTFNMGDVSLTSLGRILQFDVNLKNICPGKEAALAVILSERGVNGTEKIVGMKTLLIPALSGTECSDILVKCVKFVVPEELSGDGTSLCKKRNFSAKFILNYTGTDFVCCDKI